MSSHDDLRSLLDNPAVAVEKLAEIAAIGRLERDIRREEGLTDKVALSLNDLTTTLSDYGNKATEWIGKNPHIAAPAIGAGVGTVGGAALGGLSGMLSRRRKKNIVGNTITGGLAGGAAGLGLGTVAGFNADGIKSLARKAMPGLFASGGAGATGGTKIPGDVVTPNGGSSAGNAVTPEQLASRLKELEEARSANPVAQGVNTAANQGGSWLKGLIARNPIWATILGADAAYSTGSALDAARLGNAKPRISTSLADFRAGFNKLDAGDAWKSTLPSRMDEDTMKAIGGVLNTGDDNALRKLILQGLAGKTQSLNVPAAADADRWGKTLESIKGMLGKVDPSKATTALEGTATRYDEVLKRLSELEQMNPDALDELGRLRKALDRSATSVAGVADRLPDSGSTITSIEELLASLGKKPPLKTVDVTPSQIGNVSRAAVPADRWVAIGSEPYGIQALERAGYRMRPNGHIVPSMGAVPWVRRLLSGRRIPLYDSLGPKGRLATRAGVYALPVLLDLYLQGRRQKLHAQDLANQVAPIGN